MKNLTIMTRLLILIVVMTMTIASVSAATLTCQQTTSSSLSVPQFSTGTIKLKCTASGGSVNNIQITPNADPSPGLSITSTETMSTSLTDQGSDTVTWQITGDSPNTYQVTYTISSSGTNSWIGASTTQVVVPSVAKLTVDYVLPPSLFTPTVENLDFKITNIGGTTANNVNMELYNGNTKVADVDYPTTISAGAAASYSWTNATGFNESGTYTTKVYIGDVLQDTSTVDILTASDARNFTLGYELISLKKVPENSSTLAVLDSVDGQFSKIWRWNTTTENFEAYDPAIPFSFTKITTMDVSKGYWIKFNDTNASFEESGSNPTTTNIGLVTGYNMIGFPSTTSKNVTDGYSTISGNFEKIWKWDSDTGVFKAYDPSLPNSFNTGFGELNPGEGYWLKMNASDTLTVTN